MKQVSKYFIAAGLWIALVCVAANAQTTEFVYQGQLQNSSAPASGNFDFEFLLFDALAGPNQIGSTLTRTSVPVTNGTFSVKLDFGATFPGASRFLEIHVRQNGGGAFTPLTPRQAVSNSPYAMKSLNSDTATNATNATSATTAATATNSSQLNGQTGSFYQNAANLSSGTIPDVRLSSNVALLNTVQTFSAAKTFSAASVFNSTVGIGTASPQRALSIVGGLVVDQSNQNTTSNGFGITFGSFSGEGISSNRGAGANPNGLDFFAGSGTTPRVSLTNSGNFGIGTTAPGERLEIASPDATVRIRNTNDSGGGYVQNSFSTLQLGMFNPSASAVGQVPAGGKRAFFGVGADGRVGSTTNLNNGNPTFRNLLDDGSGNALISGNIAAHNLPGLEFDVPNINEGDFIFDVGPGQTAILKTITVDVPANGFLVFIGSAYAHPFPANSGTFGSLQLFDETANTTFATATFPEIPGGYYATESIHGVLPVPAGSRTFSLKLQCSNGGGDHMGYFGNRSSFVVMFFPVRY